MSFIKDETHFKGQYSKGVFNTVFAAYRPYRLKIASLIVFGFVGRLLLLGNANLVSWWADPGARPSVLRAVTYSEFISLLILVTSAGFVLTSIYRIAFSRLSALAISRLYDEVTYRTSRLPMVFFDTQPVGRVVTRFSSDYGNVFRLFGGPLAEFLAIVFDLVSMTILIGMASPYFLALFVGVAFLQAGVYWLNRGALRRERRRLAASRSPSIAHFAESVQGVTSIRVFDRVRTFFDRFQRLNSEYLRARIRTGLYLTGFSLQMGALTALLLLSTGATGWFLMQSGRVSLGDVGVAFAFIMLSANSVQMFFEWMAQFEEAMTGVERLDDYLRRDLEPGLRLPSTADFAVNPAQLKYTAAEEEHLSREKITLKRAAGISVQSLRFRYAENLPFVLDGLSFDIKAGEKVGIVGRTGSGKSSLIQALFRFYPIDAGEIRIEGHRANVDGVAGERDGVDLGLYRRSIAYIAQEPTLFRGTLRENLDLKRSHSDAVLIESLERVDLGVWFRHQEQGLDAFIEERGKISRLESDSSSVWRVAFCRTPRLW